MARTLDAEMVSALKRCRICLASARGLLDQMERLAGELIDASENPEMPGQYAIEGLPKQVDELRRLFSREEE